MNVATNEQLEVVFHGYCCDWVSSNLFFVDLEPALHGATSLSDVEHCRTESRS